jgi:hypothetical protein
MSTTRCATVITRVLVRSRFAPAVLTLLNVLLDTSHLVTALVVALAEIAVALSSQSWPKAGTASPVQTETTSYRATNAASSACTS